MLRFNPSSLLHLKLQNVRKKWSHKAARELFQVLTCIFSREEKNNVAATDAVAVQTPCKETKSGEQVKSFPLPDWNCSRLNLCARSFQHSGVGQRGLMRLTISNWLQGEQWPLDLNLGHLSPVRSEILFFLYLCCAETAACHSGLPAPSPHVFKVELRIQIEPNEKRQSSQKRWLLDPPTPLFFNKSLLLSKSNCCLTDDAHLCGNLLLALDKGQSLFDKKSEVFLPTFLCLFSSLSPAYWSYYK